MNKKLYLTVFLFAFLFFNVGDVFSANISIDSGKSNVVENQKFTATAYIDTQGVRINNAEGTIFFPKDLLEVESINIIGSIFSIWVEQPTFSNTSGTISFNGGVPTPGYIGSKGIVASVLFKAKKEGIANVSFSSVSIYANDGLGTNVASSNRDGFILNITPYKGAETDEEIIVSDKLPPSPIITSIEMPDPEAWYSLNKATFSWNLPEKVTAVQVLFNNLPNSTPNINYSPPIDQKTVTDLSDGIRYLHVRFKNSAGWGKTSHRKIKIDNTGPTDLNIISSLSKDDLVLLKISSQDKTSAVVKYKISIDGILDKEIVVSSDKTDVTLSPQKNGNHEVGIIAYDRAGNLSEKNIVVKFPLVNSPEIIRYSESITKREKIEIVGVSYPNTDVKIWLQSEKENPKSYIVKTLSDGTFSFLSDPIEKTGLTSFWVEAIRSKDVVSLSTEKYFVQVNKTAFVRTSLLTIEILSVFIPTLLLIIILIYLTLHAYHRLNKTRKRLMMDLKETESDAHKIFRIIKEDAKESVKIFNNKEIKSKLTKDEKEVINSLAKDVEEAEEYFTKRIKNIEKKDI